MSGPHVTPSNAYRHALEQIGVGRREEALRTLINGMQSKRQRNWSKDHVQIMYKVNELAIEQRYSVRDVYQTYHRLCQTSNMDSFVELLEDYLTRVRARCDHARQEAEKVNEAKADKEDDLDQTPEQLMLGLQLVDSEAGSREILTPWIKYMVEAFRTAMEVIFRTPKAFLFYHQVCRDAFDFCRAYERNWDFRRVCENVRYHLNRLKTQTSEGADKHRQRVDFNDPALQALWLETRFHQLEVASAMELWQEAARSIEDINMCLSDFDAEPEPALMETYYHKLSDIFWASKNYLFHAYTFREYAMLKQQSDETTPEDNNEDPADLASAVLLAVLAVPPSTRLGEPDSQNTVHSPNQQHLAELLGFKKDAPTRARLLTEVTESIGFLEEVHPQALRAYELLEQEFGPTSLTAELQPILEELAKHPTLARYVAPLKETAVIRIIQQCSAVYETLRYEKFLSMLPQGLDALRIELLVLHAARDYKASVSVDWHSKLLRFGGVAGSHIKETQDGHTMTVIHSSIDQSVTFREQLKVLGLRLQNVLDRVAGDGNKDMNREQVFAYIREGASQDHEAVADRLDQIERRQLSFENARSERERRTATVKAEQQLQQQLDERLRLEDESKRRAAAQEAREKEALAMAKKMQLVAALQEKVQEKNSGSAVAKVAKKLETLDIAEVDEADIIQLGKEVLEREQQEKQRLRREAAKFHEYYVRALRVEEAARMVEMLKERRQVESERVAQYFEKQAKDRKAEHAEALAQKKQLLRVQPFQQEWSDGLLTERRQIYEKARGSQEKRMTELKHKQEAEKARRKREEEERRKHEEEERIQREEEEAEKTRLREQALRLQQERLVEMEAREARERQERQERMEKDRQETLEQEQERSSRLGRAGPSDGDARTWSRPEQRAERSDRFADRGDRFGDRGDRFGDRGDRGDRFADRGDRFADRGDREGGDGGSWGRRQQEQQQPADAQDWRRTRGRQSEQDQEQDERPARASPFGDARTRSERPSRFADQPRDQPPSGGGLGFRRSAPAGGDGEDRPARRFGGGDSEDRPARRFGGGDSEDRPARRFGGGDSEDRPARRFGGDDEERPSGGVWSRRTAPVQAPIQEQQAESKQQEQQQQQPAEQQPAEQAEPKQQPQEQQQDAEQQDDGWTSARSARTKDRRPGSSRGGRGGGFQRRGDSGGFVRRGGQA